MVINSFQGIKVALLSVLSIYALNAAATYETQIEGETQKRLIVDKAINFAKFIGADANELLRLRYHFCGSQDAQGFFDKLFWEKRKDAIFYANRYIQQKKTQINKLSVNDISTAVKTRAILLASGLGYLAYCKGSTHGEAAIKGLLGATVGYFAYNNPLIKSWFLKSKKDQEMSYLVAEYECMRSLDDALNNAQINTRAKELFDVDQEIEETEKQLKKIRDIPIEDEMLLDVRLDRFKDKQIKLKRSQLPYEGEIMDPRVTIKTSKINAMDTLLGDKNKNIPWASVDKSR